ncbi:hypothetical protein C1646_704605 [Rhizophagus diaphanus]|nr:hypothetical protein C1646_704605 [Rhizophagus diaphanus] [Rhizophagus sp. MUCL 43196]
MYVTYTLVSISLSHDQITSMSSPSKRLGNFPFLYMFIVFFSLNKLISFLIFNLSLYFSLLK